MKTTVSRWGDHGVRPQPRPENDALFGAFEATAFVDIACDPAAAWDLLADVRRIGEFSPECIDARWIDGFSGPVEGARFEGTNRIINRSDDSEYIWIRPCTVLVATRPVRFSYSVGDRYDGTPATVWDTHIDPTTDGCRITQHFRHLPDGLSGIRHAADETPERAAAIVHARTEQLADGMNETLQRMKRLLEATA